jgi:cell division protein FtsB
MFILAMTLALGMIAYTLLGPGGGGKRAQLQAELDRIEEENRRLEAENRRLTIEVKALKSRRDYLEKVARDELGLVKKDELVFRLPGGDQPVRKKEQRGSPDGGPGQPGPRAAP